MDAMQKRRIKKVAITHIAITILCVVFVFTIPFYWVPFFLFLQPQFLLLEVLNTNPGGGILDATEFWGCIIAVPLWSICFGWIYVKFTNCLNHFPVLGKRVF
jgi:hypothetical protein